MAGLDVDDVIESRDPGGLASARANGKVNNVNRQLVSTAAGLALLDSTYAVKLRSDALLFSPDLLRSWRSFPDAAAKHPLRVLDHRVVITTHYSRNPARVDRRLTYHPSDVLQLGTLADLRRLWAAPLFGSASQTPRVDRGMVAEQWYWTSCLAAAGIRVQVDRRDPVAHSRASLAANFVIVPPASVGLAKETLHGGDRLSCYCYADWLNDDRRLAHARPSLPGQTVTRWVVSRTVRRPHFAAARAGRAAGPDVEALPTVVA